MRVVVLTTVLGLAAVSAWGAQVAGVIVDTKDIAMRNKEQAHKVLLLRTQEGQNIVADLGPTENLKASFEKDRQVRLEVRPGRVGRRTVLLVTSGDIEEQPFQVDRPLRQQAAVRPQQRQQQLQNMLAERRIQGEVTHEKIVDFKNQDLAHQVVMIKSDRDATWWPG